MTLSRAKNRIAVILLNNSFLLAIGDIIKTLVFYLAPVSTLVFSLLGWAVIPFG